MGFLFKAFHEVENNHKWVATQENETLSRKIKDMILHHARWLYAQRSEK